MSSNDPMSDAQTEPCPACGSILDVTGAQIFAERTCPVCGTQINVRRTFGHYELMSSVGHGGQGIVYRAVDNTLNRLVALKLLRTEYSSDPEFVAQFEAEARVTASINHPNVVRVFSFGSGEGHVFLAMELVDKGTFDDLMEKLGRVPEARALQVGIEIARGLKAGYEKGLIHRDVKPGNILFAEDGTSKIVDFGLAMFFEQSASQTGEIWGTPYYLSPERLNRVQEDFRSDIYSLGATLFHAIAGRPPFEAEDASHVALKHLRSTAVSIQAFAPDVSNATAYVINRTLNKNTADRPQSYDEFIEQLQFAREEALARASGGGQQKARVVLDDVGSQRASSWVTIVTIIILVAGIGVGIFILTKAVKGDKEPTAQVSEAGFGTIDRFGPGWVEARGELLNRNFPAAAAAFGALAGKHAAGSTERSWAMVHQALALQLSGDSLGAAQKLSELSGGGTQVSKFYSEQVAPRLLGGTVIPAAPIRELSRSNYEALAPLFLAIKNYELGAVDDTRALLGQFFAMQPEPSHTWLGEYKPLAKPLQDELEAFALAVGPWTMARDARARADAVVQLREAVGKLPPNSKLAGKMKELVAEAEKKVLQDRAERSKVNMAFEAKVSASSHDKQDAPARAVDGDLRTRWRNAGGDKERWLMVDLGSPKPVSRWVVHSASSGGEPAKNNFYEAKLQASDDSKKWNDIDTFSNNRAGVIDRVVPPFTARYVRVVGVRAVAPGDTTARIFEFELTNATEQAKSDYKPFEPVAMRFSAATPFVAGPIGEPSARGSTTYDEAKKTFTVKGSGADVWGNNDSFQFVWQSIQGDCEMVACVRSFQTRQDWSKALVMVRSDLTKDASHAGMAIGSGNKLQFLTRKTPGQPTISNIKANLPLPRWIKVVRKGAEVTGYHSADGKKWEETGRDSLEGIGDLAFVGFGVCSHVDGELATAEFSDVSIKPLKP